MALPEKLKKLVTLFITAFLVFAISGGLIFADDPCASLTGQDKINCYSQKVAESQGQERTLSSQIATINQQIATTEFQVAQTEEKLDRLENDISSVSGKITRIEDSLAHVSEVLSKRITETYIAGRSDPLLYLLGSVDFSDFWQRLEYLRIAQKHDKNLILQMAQTRKNYHDQKDLLEGKRKQVEALSLQLKAYKAQLSRQNREKQALLEVTQNDEARYQGLLALARAELAITSGLGSDHFVRNVSEGDAIGQVIPTQSGCSSGQHLHFEVRNNGTVSDPNGYLKPISFTYSYGPSQYDYYGTINPHGSWKWPMDEPIIINQGYGSHGFASTFYFGGVHTGIDMDSNSGPVVKAVKSGKLYAGSYTCGGTYPGVLTYSRIEQDGGIVTWYLHIIPQ